MRLRQLAQSCRALQRVVTDSANIFQKTGSKRKPPQKNNVLLRAQTGRGSIRLPQNRIDFRREGPVLEQQPVGILSKSGLNGVKNRNTTDQIACTQSKRKNKDRERDAVKSIATSDLLQPPLSSDYSPPIS